MGISKIKILNKREMEGYAKCGYYELSEIGGVWLINRFKRLESIMVLWREQS